MALHKPKILVIPGYLLYPYETGAGLAQFNFIDAVRHKADVSLLLSPVNVIDEKVEELISLWSNVKFHFWSRSTLKTIENTSLVKRVSRKIRDLLNSSGRTTKDEGKANSEKYNSILYNIENILKPNPDWMIKGLDDLLNDNKYDLIQFDLPINMGLGSIVAGRAKTIFVHHEIKFKRIRTIINGDEPDLEALNKLQNQVENREVALLNGFDAVQVFTDEDRLELEHKIDVPIYVCPFSINDDQFRKAGEGEKFLRLLFIGSDEHEPNLDGLDWFINDWLPSLESELPVKLYVIGKWSESNQLKFAHNMVNFKGFVELLSDWWPNSVLVAPIRHGAGLRTKIMEAMAASVPVITTSFGMQGIETMHGLNKVENGVEFERCMKKYILEKELFRMHQDVVYTGAKRNFSSRVIIDQRLNIIDKTLTSPNE